MTTTQPGDRVGKVKMLWIGQSAAKHLYYSIDERSTTIETQLLSNPGTSIEALLGIDLKSVVGVE